MSFVKGKSGNPSGLRPPSNKKIKNAIKSGSLEALDNLLAYMRDCRAFIDDCFAMAATLEECAAREELEGTKKEAILLKRQAISTKALGFKTYEGLMRVADTWMKYTNAHILDEEKPRAPSAKGRGGQGTTSDDDDPLPTVSLKSVS